MTYGALVAELVGPEDCLHSPVYVSLVEDVRERGEVLIFSSMHESGQRRCHTVDERSLLMITLNTGLNQITGIAAILTFPLDIEVVEAEEREAKEEEEGQKAESQGEV